MPGRTTQVWRDPARQARLAKALAGFLELSVDPLSSRRCGRLLAEAGTSDIADAALALLVQDGDTVLTGDPHDIEHLLQTTGTDARIRTI